MSVGMGAVPEVKLGWDGEGAWWSGSLGGNLRSE